MNVVIYPVYLATEIFIAIPPKNSLFPILIKMVRQAAVIVI